MSGQHTPGRLATDCADHDEPHQNIRLQIGNRTVATVWIDDAPVHDFNSEQTANARRLAACWNACEGISTELLEAAPYKDSAAFMAFLKVESQRDELLAALQRALPLIEDYDGKNSPEAQAARAAIAKATGATRQSTDDKLREEYRVGFDSPPAD